MQFICNGMKEREGQRNPQIHESQQHQNGTTETNGDNINNIKTPNLKPDTKGMRIGGN